MCVCVCQCVRVCVRLRLRVPREGTGSAACLSLRRRSFGTGRRARRARGLFWQRGLGSVKCCWRCVLWGLTEPWPPASVALPSDAARQLDVFYHDGDPLGVDGAEVAVLCSRRIHCSVCVGGERLGRRKIEFEARSVHGQRSGAHWSHTHTGHTQHTGHTHTHTHTHTHETYASSKSCTR